MISNERGVDQAEAHSRSQRGILRSLEKERERDDDEESERGEGKFLYFIYCFYFLFFKQIVIFF